MHRQRVGIWVSLGLATVAAGCTAVAEVTTAELSAVIERDGVAFAHQAIPEEVLDRLTPNRVIVVGETHHLREHYEFITALLQALHARGFRQLLVEQPQMADWLLEDYVGGGQLEPNWEPPANWQRKYAVLREFNATLPPEERVHVRAIDVNEAYYGGASSFRSLLGALVGHLPVAGPVTTFLQADYGTPTTQIHAIDLLHASLEADRSVLVASWGSDWYDTVVEMVEVERASVDIRADREGHDDYLVHRSTAIDGTVIVMAVVSAKIELEPGGSGTPFDVLDTSPENELFRLMVGTFPGQTVFLPLDDPVFTNGGVPVNFEETIYVCALKEQYDAVLQYGLAHRVPID